MADDVSLPLKQLQETVLNILSRVNESDKKNILNRISQHVFENIFLFAESFSDKKTDWGITGFQTSEEKADISNFISKTKVGYTLRTRHMGQEKAFPLTQADLRFIPVNNRFYRFLKRTKATFLVMYTETILKELRKRLEAAYFIPLFDEKSYDPVSLEKRFAEAESLFLTIQRESFIYGAALEDYNLIDKADKEDSHFKTPFDKIKGKIWPKPSKKSFENVLADTTQKYLPQTESFCKSILALYRPYSPYSFFMDVGWVWVALIHFNMLTNFIPEETKPKT